MCVLKEGKCCLVVEREAVHNVGGRGGVRIETELFGEIVELAERFQNADGVLNDGEVFEPEEIHLEESDFFDIARLGGRRVLGHDAFFGAGNILNRRVFGNGVLGDDDAAGMHGGVPREPFEFLGGVDEAFGIGVAIVERFEIGCLLQRFLHRMKLRDEFGDGVAEAIGEPESAPGVADRGARRHGSESNDLRHVIVPVFSPDIAQNIVAAVVGEVHIDIGHGDALRIEESLKKEMICDRVHVGNAGQIGDEAAGGASSAGSHHHTFALCPVDEVLHDQEVGRESGFFDNTEFVFHARAVLIGDVGAESLGETDLAEFAQIRFGCFVVGHVEVGELRFAELDVDIASIGDSLSVFNGFRDVFEECRHVFG